MHLYIFYFHKLMHIYWEIIFYLKIYHKMPFKIHNDRNFRYLNSYSLNIFEQNLKKKHIFRQKNMKPIGRQRQLLEKNAKNQTIFKFSFCNASSISYEFI